MSSQRDPNVQFADFEDTTDEWSWLIRAWTIATHNLQDISGTIFDVDNITGIIFDIDDVSGIIKDMEDIAGVAGKGTKP